MTINTIEAPFTNPFKPGAGHMPPYLAGRNAEETEFKKSLTQKIILENLMITGLRGVGKTVLLDSFKPLAIQTNWLWVGTDLSESASVSEAALATRLLADISVITFSIAIPKGHKLIGFLPKVEGSQRLDYQYLTQLFEKTPGLVSDKLKFILEFCWSVLKTTGKNGIIFAYDEAQNLTDKTKSQQYPLSLLLDVFQSLQKKECTCLLILCGLPTLQPSLVKTRTYSERMFHILTLKQLDFEETKKAITVPVETANCPIKFNDQAVKTIYHLSGGYPYLIQYICKEAYDSWIQQYQDGRTPLIPQDAIVQKLDTDFYAGRWSRITDRQKELLFAISELQNCHKEFTVQEAVVSSERLLKKPFSNSQINQMLISLGDAGMVYKDKFGKYVLAVPMLKEYILRQKPINADVFKSAP